MMLCLCDVFWGLGLTIHSAPPGSFACTGVSVQYKVLEPPDFLRRDSNRLPGIGTHTESISSPWGECRRSFSAA